ncbi:MAG TPA: hypothetical protein VLL08_01105 [Kineosporiaceae bacterium]|nr:hypothetical protein [Kineosporiaceae bacterium]
MINRVNSKWVAIGLLILTVVQLVVATFVPGLDQFEGKGFAARLALYPAMMLVVPAVWLVRARRRAVSGAEPMDQPPWAAFAWIMLPFLVDVTGNTLNLYDSLWWWDDVNHLANWLFLSLGAGLLLLRGAPRRPGELVLLVAGIGAIMAVCWEVGEYYAFIRGGTELASAYTDTLGDEVLGTLGATLGGLIIAAKPASRPAQARTSGQDRQVRPDLGR